MEAIVAGYFLPVGFAERMSEIRRFEGGKEFRGGGRIVGEICARVSTSCGDLEARVVAFLADRSG